MDAHLFHLLHGNEFFPPRHVYRRHGGDLPRVPAAAKTIAAEWRKLTG